MNRRILEPLAVACLTVYAALVFSVYAVHGFLGLECGCHVSSRSVPHTDGASLGVGAHAVQRLSPKPTKPAVSREAPAQSADWVSVYDCPICHWFKLAQDRAVSFDLSPDLSIAAAQPCLAAPWLTASPVEHLARGPPILSRLVVVV